MKKLNNDYTALEAIKLVIASKAMGVLCFACDEIDGINKIRRKEKRAQRYECKAERIRSELNKNLLKEDISESDPEDGNKTEEMGA